MHYSPITTKSLDFSVQREFYLFMDYISQAYYHLFLSKRTVYKYPCIQLTFTDSSFLMLRIKEKKLEFGFCNVNNSYVSHTIIWVLNLISKPLFYHLGKRGVLVIYWVLNNQ